MLKFVLDDLKIKKMCNDAVKKLPYLLRYVPKNGGTLKSFLDCYKNQEICNRATDNYPHPLEFVSE